MAETLYTAVVSCRTCGNEIERSKPVVKEADQDGLLASAALQNFKCKNGCAPDYPDCNTLIEVNFEAARPTTHKGERT